MIDVIAREGECEIDEKKKMRRPPAKLVKPEFCSSIYFFIEEILKMNVDYDDV